MRCLPIIVFVGLVLCGCADTAPVDGPATTSLYVPASSFEVEVLSFEGIDYMDVLGLERSLNVAIYRPVDAPTPAPIVLMSHGGASGKTNPTQVLPEWAKRVASTGYVVVAIAHPKRDADSYQALCDHLGVSDEIQCALKINWERPHDVTRVLDWLEEQVQSESWSGVLDLTRIAHLGHSSGAGCSMMLAGAPRNYVCAQPYGMAQGEVVACAEADRVEKRDARVKAILAFSNQGPEQDGFMASSFGQIDGPVLIGTGSADGDEGEPDNRTKAFELLKASDAEEERFLIFIDDPGAVHTLFSAELGACEKISGEARCKEMRDWLYASALAFLDYELNQIPQAGAWLREGGPTTPSHGAASWAKK
jgi:dienelactone hydrolase